MKPHRSLILGLAALAAAAAVSAATPIVDSADMAEAASALDRLYAADHPDWVSAATHGNNLSAFYSLIYGTTAVAPVTQEIPASVATTYRIIAGAEPLGLRIAHGSARGPAPVAPIVVIVNAANPLARLSTDQVTHVFTTGGRKRDLTHWDQLGVTGPLAGRPIHPCGLPPSDHFDAEDMTFGDFMFGKQFGAADATPGYQAMPRYRDVIAAVAADPLAIGLVAQSALTPDVRALPLTGLTAAAATASREDRGAGRYPYDRSLYLYVRRTRGHILGKWAVDYLRLALSPAGQRAIASAGGFVPLNPREIAEEEFKLESAIDANSSEPEEPIPAPPSCVRNGGEIFVAGNDLMAPFLGALNETFRVRHPEIRFAMDLQASSLGISGITAGASAFGPMARDATRADQSAFTAKYGYPPLDIVLGWDNTPDAEHFPPDGKFPPAIWVNTANPIPSLTLDEIAAILTTGGAHGDITHWGQISGDEGPVGANGGDWAKRAIHVYLPSPHGLPVVNTTRYRLGGRPWTSRAEFLPSMEDVINAVALDPFGIGFIGWWPTDEGWDRQQTLSGRIRVMPLSGDDDSSIAHGRSGERYPTAGQLHIYVNRRPGQPMDPWLKDYLELALSPEGQAILSAHAREWGFLPLDPEAAAAQRAKLN